MGRPMVWWFGNDLTLTAMLILYFINQFILYYILKQQGLKNEYRRNSNVWCCLECLTANKLVHMEFFNPYEKT